MFDLVGEEIRVGSLIAFSKANESTLCIGIVIEINNDQINYPIKSVKNKYKTLKGKTSYRPNKKWPHGRPKYGKPRKKIISSTSCIRKSYIKINPRSDTQGRIIVIKNPMFLLDNPKIAEQLEVMDMAKDVGLLPRDYELGIPVEDSDE